MRGRPYREPLVVPTHWRYISGGMSRATVFPARLKEALADYDKAEFISSIGKTDRTLRGWLAGASEPLAGTLRDIAWALSVSTDWLVGLTDDRYAGV